MNNSTAITDERVILAAIGILQKKLIYIRSQYQEVTSEEYSRMRQLDNYTSDRGVRLPLRLCSKLPLRLR